MPGFFSERESLDDCFESETGGFKTVAPFLDQRVMIPVTITSVRTAAENMKAGFLPPRVSTRSSAPASKLRLPVINRSRVTEGIVVAATRGEPGGGNVVGRFAGLTSLLPELISTLASFTVRSASVANWSFSSPPTL